MACAKVLKCKTKMNFLYFRWYAHFDSGWAVRQMEVKADEVKIISFIYYM